MSILHLLLTYITFFLSPITPNATPEIFLGPLQADAGVSPLTGRPSGWYTSDVTIQVLAPNNVLANGKPIPGGFFTISDEGQHQIEFQPGPTGVDNLVTQLVDIDKTAPKVTWLSQPGSLMSGPGNLSAEITDEISGVCEIESSLDNGHSWEKQTLSSDTESQHEVSFSIHKDFSEMPSGSRLVILLARDCAGNISPAETLVIQVR